MQRFALAVLAFLLVASTAATPVAAQGKKAQEAADVANQVIEELAAWNLKAARRTSTRPRTNTERRRSSRPRGRCMRP